MDTQIIVALIIAVPVIIVPLALLWHLSMSSIHNVVHGIHNRHKTVH